MKFYLFAIASAMFVSGVAQKPVQVPSEVAKTYDEERAAFTRGDWKAFFADYDASYYALSPKGKKTTLQQLKAEVAKDMKGTTGRTYSIQFTNCKMTPNGVQVSFVGVSSSTYKGRTLTYKEIGTDTWQKKGSGWKQMRTVDKFFGPLKSGKK